MYRWLCTSGEKDSWSFVKDTRMDVNLIVVWRVLDEWYWQIVGTHWSGKHERRGDAMRMAERQFDTLNLRSKAWAS